MPMTRLAATVFFMAMVAGLPGAGCGDVDDPDHPDPLDHRAGQEAQGLPLGTKDVKFAPAELTAKTGVTTELTLGNLDGVEHDFQIDDINVDVIESDDGRGEHDGGHAGGDLGVHAEGGETDFVTFVVNEPGSYEFYCTIPGHKESGMVGTLIVE